MSGTRKYCAPRSIGYPLAILDWFVDKAVWVRGQRTAHPDLARLKVSAPNILMMSSGHLGDALTLSYTFPLIRQRYPNAQIDVLVGDWCAPILRGNPDIRKLIFFSHAGTNRKALTKAQKWAEMRRTGQQAIQALRDEDYDFSVDVRFANSPLHFLLPFLNVHQRIGFGTRGMGGLLDREFFLPDGEFHHFTVIADLLRVMDVDCSVETIQPYFPLKTPILPELAPKIGTSLSQPYWLLFPEAGDAVKELSPSFWQQLVQEIQQQRPMSIVICGQRPDSHQLAHTLAGTTSSPIIDAVGKLTITDLAGLAEHAAGAFTLDSLPAHLCTIFCPTVAFFNHSVGYQFFPINKAPVWVLHNHVQSRNLTLNRPGFTSTFVDTFDAGVIKQAVAYMGQQRTIIQ